MTLCGCPLSIFCSRGTPPNPESITPVKLGPRGSGVRQINVRERTVSAGPESSTAGTLTLSFSLSLPPSLPLSRVEGVVWTAVEDCRGRASIFMHLIPSPHPMNHASYAQKEVSHTYGGCRCRANMAHVRQSRPDSCLPSR